MPGRRTKLPLAVLEKARAAVKVGERAKSEPVVKAKKATPREKVIAALKKLHPMD